MRHIIHCYIRNDVLDISHSYDIRGQLLEERRNGVSVSYAYEKTGNRVRKTDAKGATLYRFNGKNQLIETENHDGKNQFTYDRQGGIVEEKNARGIRLFSYNSRHQQTKVETESGNVQENRYDVENLRFELLENGRQTSFVYYNGELLHEEGREERQTSYHLGVGIDAFRRKQQTYYYQQDEQLSTAFITDEQGIVQNSYLYDAFGYMLDSKERIANRILYAEQQYDNLAEQYYLRARHYNPALSRFMQEDICQGDGLNLYTYCGNNPVIYYDPSGYDKKPATTGNGCPPQGRFPEDPNELFPENYAGMTKEVKPDGKITYTVEAGGQTYIVEYHPNHGGSDHYDGNHYHVKKESAYPPPGKTQPIEFRIPDLDPNTPCVSSRPGHAPRTFAPGDLLPTKINE